MWASGLLELSGGKTVAKSDGKGDAGRSLSEVRNISTRAVKRRRTELDPQRTLLHRTLRDAASIKDAMDVLRAPERTLHPPRKSGGQRCACLLLFYSQA